MSRFTAREEGAGPGWRAPFDRLAVEVHRSRQSMGRAAGRAVADRMRLLLVSQDRVGMVFAGAPSQNELVAAEVRKLCELR